jgi:hypothetical protein
MGACDTETILVSAAWAGNALGMAVGFDYSLTVQDIPIRGEDAIGPSCRPVVAADCSASVTFLVKPPIDPIANMNTTGDLVITTRKGAGGDPVVHTLNDMIPRGFAQSMNRDSGPAVYSQAFVHKGNMTANPID